MRNNIHVIFLILAGVVFICQSCYYDNPPKPTPFDCSETSFSTHIVPIFENSCATTGCHNGTTPPDLRPEAALQELRADGHINTTNPEESLLYKTVIFEDSPMPPGGTQIPQLDQVLILCWISEGAPNN